MSSHFVCSSCRGFGLVVRSEPDKPGSSISHIVDSDLCLECNGSGLCGDLDLSLKQGEKAIILLAEANGYLITLTEKLKSCKKRLHNTPSADGSQAKEVNDGILDAIDAIDEILDELGTKKNF